MASTLQWATFFNGQYNMWLASAHVGVVTMDFTVNTDWCLRVAFKATGINVPIDKGFFHLRLVSGTHVIGASHNNNWNGNGPIPDSFLDGGVMEGEFDGGKKYFRLGCWEVGGFAPPGVPVSIEFKGKTYKPQRSPLDEVHFIGLWKKPRPDTNYPWNLTT